MPKTSQNEGHEGGMPRKCLRSLWDTAFSLHCGVQNRLRDTLPTRELREVGGMGGDKRLYSVLTVYCLSLRPVSVVLFLSSLKTPLSAPFASSQSEQ